MLSRLVTINFLRNALQVLSAVNDCLKNLSVYLHVFLFSLTGKFEYIIRYTRWSYFNILST